MKQWTTISFLFFFIREIIKWQSLFIYRNLLHHRKNDIREYIVFFFFLIKSRKSSTQLCAFFLSFDSGANATYVTGFHGLYRLLRNVAYLLPTSNLHFLCISTHLPWQVTYQLPTKYKLKWNFQFMIYVLRDIGFINKYVVDIIVFRIFNMLR